MYDVFKIVNWLRVKNHADMRSNPNEDELTQMKAMKLLYYIQAASLVITHHRMFDNDIVAWQYGPVVEAVHQKYYHQRGIVGSITKNDIQDYNKLQQDPVASSILNSIYEIYGHSSAYDLMRQTHMEKPWQDTPRNGVIKDSLIEDFYSKVFVLDDNTK